MKVFEIHGGICHRHAMEYQTAAETQGRYPPDFVFVDAPDEVFEGWGYMDGTFIKPTPPEGWLYDDKTGTFYPVDATPPKRTPTNAELALENERLRGQLALQAKHNTFLEDCLIELGNILYA